MGPGGVCAGWVHRLDLIFSELSASDAPEPDVLRIDAADLKAHPTASSLNKGGPPPDRSHQGGHGQQAPWGLPQQRSPTHLREGQCRDFTGADGVHKDLPPAAAVIGERGMTGTQSARCWPSRASHLASRPVAAARNQSITTPVLDKGSSKKWPTAAFGRDPPSEENLWGTVLFCSNRPLSLGAGSVPRRSWG